MPRQFDPSEPEMMDKPQPVTRELEVDLENLRKLNRWFGSYGLIRGFLHRWTGGSRTCRILDLATGYGDIPRMIVDWSRARGMGVKIDAVDVNPSILQIAKNASASYREINYIRADARTFTESMTYDIVFCSLALHHFSDDDAARVLRTMCNLSHDKVLVADLERSVLTKACVWLITGLIFREEMTKFDGRLSVRRAFSYAEFHQLAERAGWENFYHRRFLPARQAMWMCLREEAPVLDIGGRTLDYAT